MRRCVACLALVAGCGVTTAEDQQSIVAGSLASDEAVVAIVQRPLCSDDFTVTCTGTVIAPQAVLSAAHCVASELEVHVGAPVGSGRFITVTEAIRHPQFDDATHTFDLAILRLAEPVAVTPLALPTATLDASFVGATVRIVGFGVEAASAIADGERRAGTMQIESIDAYTFVATPAPSNTCGGDSGGPVFVTASGGEQLLGITVAGDPTCVARAVDGRVDISIADFIQPTLDAPSAAQSGDDGPACPGGCAVGNDASAWLVLVLVGCRSRRRMRADSTR